MKLEGETLESIAADLKDYARLRAALRELEAAHRTAAAMQRKSALGEVHKRIAYCLATLLEPRP